MTDSTPSGIPQPPTAEETDQICIRFLDIARQVANSNPHAATDLLVDYLTDNHATASFRLWYFASVGPILVAAGLQKLNRGTDAEHAMWGIVQEPGHSDDDPDALAAIQSVAAQLNDDREYAQDIVTAHFDAAKRYGYDAAHTAMLGMVTQHLKMAASLTNEGAYDPTPTEE